MHYLKRIASCLPVNCQQEMKRFLFHHQIRRKKFRTDEEEYFLIEKIVKKGDWVLDIGANIGHYTMKLSELVGKEGRAFAFEPVPCTFELLSSNCAKTKYGNITLFNIAVTKKEGLRNMKIPYLKSGLSNYYMAQLCEETTGVQVFCLPLDSIHFSNSIKLVKIDVEGHELETLKGMSSLLKRDFPVLIIEDNDKDVGSHLSGYGYHSLKLEKSSNRIFAVDAQILYKIKGHD